MKRVLVTGADGFIGSHLIEHLVARGYAVRAFVAYNSFNSHGWLDTLPADIHDAIEVVAGDIRDMQQVEQAMKEMDAVFHLAALISIPYSYEAPAMFTEVNVGGTLHVLQAARRLGTARVLITSTSEVYGTAQYVPIDETHPLQAQSPYSASKIGADQMALAFYRSFAVPVTIVRPFNTYGPRQSARAVIPTVISQLMNQRAELHLGDLSPTRDWVFVSDTVRAFEAIATAANTIGEELNIATQSEVSVGEMVRILIAKIYPAAKIIQDPDRMRPANSEVFRLLGSNEKISKLTGWRPTVTFEQGLEQTIEWFRQDANLAHYKHLKYNI